MLILAIETSCDETAVALVKKEKGGFFVVDENISSQVKIHARFGGDVTNLAAREHLKNLPLLLEEIILRNKIRRNDIGLIAATQGPGLIPALLIGTGAAKALAYAWKKPLIGVNHIEGHIYANFLQGSAFPLSAKASNSPRPNLLKFPLLALVVSGGHTELIFMKKHLNYKVIGQTLDDAAGEAFDKAAKILGLGYPGGPAIAKHATRNAKRKSDFHLPRPMINSGNLDFSFSGLKTALLYTVRDNPEILKSKKLVSEICFEFQQAVIDVLVKKTIAAAKKYNPKTVLLGGGVSANKELRAQLDKAMEENMPQARYWVPDTKYSLDNASMIAIAGWFRYHKTRNKKILLENWEKLEADANLRLKNL